MDHDALIRTLRATFVVELDEQIEALEKDLLEVERGTGGPPPDVAARLFRAAHTLKGAARAVALPHVEQACHHAEGLLADLRNGSRAFDAKAAVTLLAFTEALSDVAASLRGGGDGTSARLAAVNRELEVLVTGFTGAREPQPQPRVAPPGTEEPEPMTAGDAGPGGAPLPIPTSSALPTSMRVAADAIGIVVARSGELAVARARLVESMEAFEGDVGPAAARAVEDLRAVTRLASRLDLDLRRLQMRPFADATAGLDRAVRDLATSQGKDVQLVVEGGEVELDRSVIEGLRTPLLQLIRNAIDHGIEHPDVRRSIGKPAVAQLLVRATSRGAEVEIEVADDGRGLDAISIRRTAAARSISIPAGDDDADLFGLVFLPGFSTAVAVTEVSGRGVGLDVVRDRAELLHGRVDVASESGRGATFTMTVPVTATAVRALLVAAAGQTFALATTTVRRIVRIAPENIHQQAGRQVLKIGDDLIPLAALATTLGSSDPAPLARGAKAVAAIVRTSAGEVAFVIDAALAEREIVVGSLGARVRRSRLATAATILPSGQLALVLQTAELVRRALGRPTAAIRAAKAEEAIRRRILVVDDSVTTRTLVKSILEANGYDVVTAVDGADAWRLLQERGADAVVSDVEMPRMDGFTLTEAIRASPRFAALPVILVTALAGERERGRGLEAGADAYLVKSGFDQVSLLDTIKKLL